MPTPADLQCLSLIATHDNKPIAPDISDIKQKIRNYGNFYTIKHSVPKSEVFYSAVVNSSKLIALCDGNPTVRIFIIKDSDNDDNMSDFRFLIMASDVNGETLLDDPLKDLPNPQYLDQNCCKNPPPNASDFS